MRVPRVHTSKRDFPAHIRRHLKIEGGEALEQMQFGFSYRKSNRRGANRSKMVFVLQMEELGKRLVQLNYIGENEL